MSDKQICPECGHHHQGRALAYICIGCPCQARPIQADAVLSPGPSAAAQKQILEAVLRYLYKHGDGSAEVCNLWEQVHTLMGCEECQHRWEGTMFVARPPETGATR